MMPFPEFDVYIDGLILTEFVLFNEEILLVGAGGWGVRLTDEGWQYSPRIDAFQSFHAWPVEDVLAFEAMKSYLDKWTSEKTPLLCLGLSDPLGDGRPMGTIFSDGSMTLVFPRSDPALV